MKSWQMRKNQLPSASADGIKVTSYLMDDSVNPVANWGGWD